MKFSSQCGLASSIILRNDRLGDTSYPPPGVTADPETWVSGLANWGKQKPASLSCLGYYKQSQAWRPDHDCRIFAGSSQETIAQLADGFGAAAGRTGPAGGTR